MPRAHATAGSLSGTRRSLSPLPHTTSMRSREMHLVELQRAQLGHANPTAVQDLEHGVVATPAPRRLVVGRRRHRAGVSISRWSSTRGSRPESAVTCRPSVGSTVDHAARRAPNRSSAAMRPPCGRCCVGRTRASTGWRCSGERSCAFTPCRGVDVGPRDPLGEQAGHRSVGRQRACRQRRVRANELRRVATRRGPPCRPGYSVTTCPTLDPRRFEPSRAVPRSHPALFEPSRRQRSSATDSRNVSTDHVERDRNMSIVHARAAHNCESRSAWRRRADVGTPRRRRRRHPSMVEHQRDQHVVGARDRRWRRRTATGSCPPMPGCGSIPAPP